jgi:ABC-type Zn2+ transport system substrate-binding protein/surface adhesin
MTTSRKILTVALTAVALTAVSLATTGNAFAGGKHHHHHHRHHAHHHHGHHGHHHHHRYGRWYGGGGVFASGVVASSCWQWIETRRGLAKIYVCDDDSD